MAMTPPTLDFEAVQTQEWQEIERKRGRFAEEEWFTDPANRFGIALSGGGIRSATINLGFLELLNRFGIVERADYLSTVSGGGYLGGYVQAKLWRERQSAQPFAQLFATNDIDHLRRFGDYLAPGSGFRAFLHRVRMAGALVASLFMNLFWVSALVATVGRTAEVLFGWAVNPLIPALVTAAVVLLAWHFFLHGLRHIGLWSSDWLNTLEGVVLAIAAVWTIGWLSDPWGGKLWYFAATLLVLGFFANPNVLSLHRFYRDRLQTAYLMRSEGPRGKTIALRELWQAVGPYPLVNTCLNVLNETDRAFAGTAASDYFLLSPLFCGSKLTGYAATREPSFKNMTLATAVACSGAAVNPGMGTNTNRVLAFVLALLNLRLGYWVENPKVQMAAFVRYLRWWPYYHLREVLSKTDTTSALVNIADGGFIENLAVYELLRRRCALIIAVDATADPAYVLSDLTNLVTRARNELGLVIRFRQDPERLVRPLPSRGFSQSHFVVADIEDLPGKPEGTAPYKGLLVYVKSSLRQQRSWKTLTVTSDSFAYKTYHPRFPHESTADQFFDPVQWNAYYYLGRFIAGDVLHVDARPAQVNGSVSISDLYRRFDALTDEAALEADLGL